MSKSTGSDLGTIWLTDTPDTIKAKVARAQTDSIRQLAYDPASRPGVSNLMQIFAAAKVSCKKDLLPVIFKQTVCSINPNVLFFLLVGYARAGGCGKVGKLVKSGTKSCSY